MRKRLPSHIHSVDDMGSVEYGNLPSRASGGVIISSSIAIISTKKLADKNYTTVQEALDSLG